MNSETIRLWLWYAQPILQSVVAAVLWRRKLHKQFPIFFAYVLSQIAIFGVTFPVWRSGNYEWYYWVFWTGAAISAVLGFKVIHEIFLDVFRPYHTLKDLGTVVYRWAGLVMVLVSVVVGFSIPLIRFPLAHAVMTLQRSVRLVQFGLILFLLLFSRFLGVSRRQFSFGIALGAGFFAGIELLLLAMNAGGLLHTQRFNLANMAFYNLSIVIWLAYTLAQGEARKLAANPLQTQRWERGLADIQHPVPADSLIPMFESMVERAISRSANLEEELPGPAVPTDAPKSYSAASSGSGSKLRR